ncbi:MAG: cbb3-type cytochrome oxidase assembly protein CcoS [Devosiaceae bacterium]|nr:cbb3-type cytochrome oxidase assembly protein CcoS [Devosiaceae bacterium MH13]
MDILLFLIPLALFASLVGLIGFSWALKSGQFDDLQGAAERILYADDHPEHQDPIPQREAKP